MRLSVLDALAVNPGDLSWDCFSAYADISVYPLTPSESVIERIKDSEAVLLNKIRIDSKILSECPSLRYIGVLATGYNVIDIEAAKKAGVCVTNVPSYSTDAVAQHVFSLILHFSNQVDLHSNSVMAGDWKKAPIFCYWKTPLFELSGKTLGIFGYGNIGKRVAQIAKAFGMNVIFCPHRPTSELGAVSKEELFKNADIITLHAPLTKETENLINKDTLSLVKDGAYLINTARGGLVCEQDVKNALESGKLAGYAADVLTEEPMAKNCVLFGAKNTVLTPHLAWAPKETRERCMNIALENFKGWLNGKPQNVIT